MHTESDVHERLNAKLRLHDFYDGRTYAMPPTLQDALAVPIPRELVASWLFYAEKNAPTFPIKSLIWDIRRLVGGDYELAEEWLLPVLWEWKDSIADQLPEIWAEAARPYRDGEDMLVLRELASIYHHEETGLWVLSPDDDCPAETEAIKRLHILFNELDNAAIESLEIAAGITNPAALAAMLARPLLEITEADLATLSIRDRLRVENEILMARSEHQKKLHAALGPLVDHPELPLAQAETLAQFWAHLPSGKIIHESSRGLWASGSFDKHCGRVKDAMRAAGPGMLASTWLSQHRAVQSLGWDPGEPMIIENKVLTEAGWVHAPGSRSFNTYLPPTIVPRGGDVSRWLRHIEFIYPNEADHITKWFAHRVQRPGDKVNHGLVFIGDPGIGKDTAIEPVVAAIGPHNFRSITAARFFKSDFNGYLKSVLLRIDEVHDLGGESKYAFHDRTKPVLAAPPAAHEINEKFVPHHSARNVAGVILTSNHADALYLDRNDRRHFVCISERTKDDFPAGYFDDLYSWFENGGNEAVAHYLANLDLTGFNAKAPPPKTAGWHMVVAAGFAPESGDLADVLEVMGKPPAITLSMIRARTPPDSQLRLTFEDPKARRSIPKRLAEIGYVAVPNPDARDSGGRWRMPAGRIAIYARQELGEGDRLVAARQLTTAASLPPPIP